jgi:hypothetical protein
MAKKMTAAVAMGKRRMKLLTPEQRKEFAAQGAPLGGKARAESLTPQRRREIARKAAAARWGKEKEKKRQ